MPVKASAIKALKVSKRRAQENERGRSQMKRAMKVAVLAGDKKKADLVKKAQSKTDRAVKANLIHRNKAARLVSRLYK